MNNPEAALTSSPTEARAHTDPRRRARVTWLLIVVLLFLRIPYFGGVRLLTTVVPAEWLNTSFEVSTYLLSALLIWWERDRLAELHIERVALVLFVLAKPVALLLRWLLYTLDPWLLLCVPISAGLVVALLWARFPFRALPTVPWWWLLVGIVVGTGISIFWNTLLHIGTTGPVSKGILWLPLYYVGYAGVAEEPLFRGFLWGALRRAGWRNGWILVVQTILFGLAHMYSLASSPLVFWVIISSGALWLGLLAWRSRSIATSMLAHGFYNGNWIGF